MSNDTNTETLGITLLGLEWMVFLRGERDGIFTFSSLFPFSLLDSLICIIFCFNRLAGFSTPWRISVRDIMAFGEDMSMVADGVH